MEIRLYQPSDLEEVMHLFYDNVHSVCAKDYTNEQLDAWAPKEANVYRWESSLNKNHTLVVIDNNHIIGFGNIGQTGYLDRLYVDCQYLHQGVGSLILDHLEKYAAAKGNTHMNTQASITSKPFFEARGYTCIEKQIVERRGVRLKRYLMEKKIK
ncbi:MAG: GNAT family N-acetyltransferase [Erysipelotrichaceae bacterium]|nr:GNAT family N-acetyltransferase [Erysipelotrichaceae bacterium]